MEIAVVSHGTGAALFALLTLLLLPGWRGQLLSSLLILFSAISAVWFGLLAWYAAYGGFPLLVSHLIEILRDISLLGFLLAVLTVNVATARTRRYAIVMGSISVVLALGMAAYILTFSSASVVFGGGKIHVDPLFFGHLLLSVIGLMLVETLYRNSNTETRWAIKFLCMGLGGLLVYDFFLYSDALLFSRLDPGIWDARGAVDALTVPLIAISAARNPQWKLDLFVSRQVVFHTTAFLGAGVYLLLMAGAGYYVRIYGGSWGTALQTIFFAGALLFLLVLMFSTQVRAELKVFLAKHFYRNKYEYREEWLKFTQTLSQNQDSARFRETIVKAIANILNSSRGALWQRDEDNEFRLTARWECDWDCPDSVKDAAPLVAFMRATGWVIDLDQYRRRPDGYAGLELPGWLQEMDDAWLVVPLVQRDDLIGFIILAHSVAHVSFDWEDSDLLKTVGRQTASYLALLDATNALTRARQFEAFNRLSAFVVHDLKNLVAQLSLVATNAKKHMHNPEFVEDAITTVENAVTKMNAILEHLRKGSGGVSEHNEKVCLDALLEEVVAARAGALPIPELACSAEGLIVLGRKDRLRSVMRNLIQNAQDATPDDGSVVVSLKKSGQAAVIEVTDTGCGMDPEFIRNRLFAPFDTTKGNAGMGIGVFESREVVKGMGGEINVESVPGQGTAFRIVLPLYAEVEEAAPLDSLQREAGA